MVSNANKKSTILPKLICVYVNEEQYMQYIDSKTDFCLLFELSRDSRKSLFRIINDCFKHIHFRGIIFAINKNEILLDRLFFLKDITLNLFKKDKKVGLWGIPYCTMQSIFGNHYFSQLAYKTIPENSDYYCKNIPFYQHDSSLLLLCSRCILSDNCDGLGSRIDNHAIREYRTSHYYRKKNRDLLFETDNIKLQNMYTDFCKYIDNSDLTYADRYIYFVKNIDFGSSHSFTDRFVYHCDYLPYDDYKKEVNFLGLHVENKNFLPKIRELAKEHKISRIGYSMAFKNGVFRESYYLAPDNVYDHYLLRFFKIDLGANHSCRLRGIGIDFYDGKIKSYKVYFMVRSEILLKTHSNYIKKIGINLLDLYEKSHFNVLRLDANKQITSERIDLVYNDKDYAYYNSYFKQLPFSNKILEKLFIFGFAFEFENMKIKKINLYYRNHY